MLTCLLLLYVTQTLLSRMWTVLSHATTGSSLSGSDVVDAQFLCGTILHEYHERCSLLSTSTEILKRLKRKSRWQLKYCDQGGVSGWMDHSSSRVDCNSAWGGGLVWRCSCAFCSYSAACHWRLVCSSHCPAHWMERNNYRGVLSCSSTNS